MVDEDEPPERLSKLLKKALMLHYDGEHEARDELLTSAGIPLDKFHAGMKEWMKAFETLQEVGFVGQGLDFSDPFTPEQRAEFERKSVEMQKLVEEFVWNPGGEEE